MLEAFELAGNQTGSDEISHKSGKRVRWQCGKCGEQWEESPCQAAKRKNFCLFCSRKRPSQQYNLEVLFPDVSSQWDYAQNGMQTPRNTLPGSSFKAAWVCPFNSNHRWRDRVANRTVLLRDCPECKKQFHISYAAMVLYYYLRKTHIKCSCEKQEGNYLIDIVVEYLPGENSPIALELDGYYTHNSDNAIAREIQKDRILREKGYRILRIKESKTNTIQIMDDIITYPYDKDGTNPGLNDMVSCVIAHISGVQIQPDHRRDHWKIRQLYYHEQRLRSLAVNEPELAMEWDPNNALTPDMVTLGNHRKWLWSCPQCGYTYPATIHNRVIMRSGCPACSRKVATASTCLAATHPEIAQEWDHEKNGSRTPWNTLSGTDYAAWWRCPNGHSYQANIFERTGKDRRSCPECRSLAFRNPLLARYYDEENNPKSPRQIRAFSNEVCRWKCPEGHTWSAQPNAMQKRKPYRYCSKCFADMRINRGDSQKI